MSRSSVSDALPSMVVDRARRYRARLGPTGCEIESGGSSPVDPSADTVLSVGALPREQQTAEKSLRSLRESLPAGGQLWIIEPTRPIRSGSLRSRARREWRRRRGARDEIRRDTVGALRAAGWTIASIERFEVVDDDGHRTWWIDAAAVDL